MSEDSAPADLFAVLDDEYARAILTETSEQPMSAKTLSEACDASLPTIYRRIERLQACGLLEERTEFADEGRHYGVYRACLERIVIELTNGELEVAVESESTDAADRFTNMWEEI